MIRAGSRSIGATLGQQELCHILHRVMGDGGANDAAALFALIDQTSRDQQLDVVRQGGACDAGPIPQCANVQPLGACADKDAQHVQALF